jgi:hypothetical protein
MTSKTYTLLVTIDDGQLPDRKVPVPQALADRLAANLEVGCADWPSFAAASVDCFEGDLLNRSAVMGEDAKACNSARELHRRLRA